MVKREIYDTFILLVVITLDFLILLFLFLLLKFFPNLRGFGHWLTYIGCSISFALSIFAMYLSKITLSSIGLTKKDTLLSLFFIGLSWILTGMILWGIILLNLGGNYKISVTSPQSILKFWLFVGLSEEMFYRGYVFTWIFKRLKKNLSTIWALFFSIVLSNLIFSLSHIPQRIFVMGFPLFSLNMFTSLVKVFISGVLLGWMFYRSRSIIWVGLIHGGMDAPLLSFGEFGPIDSSIMMVVFLLFTEVMRKMVSVRRREK